MPSPLLAWACLAAYRQHAQQTTAEHATRQDTRKQGAAVSLPRTRNRPHISACVQARTLFMKGCLRSRANSPAREPFLPFLLLFLSVSRADRLRDSDEGLRIANLFFPEYRRGCFCCFSVRLASRPCTGLGLSSAHLFICATACLPSRPSRPGDGHTISSGAGGPFTTRSRGLSGLDHRVQGLARSRTRVLLVLAARQRLGRRSHRPSPRPRRR
jgi:hypothetical protein